MKCQNFERSPEYKWINMVIGDYAFGPEINPGSQLEKKTSNNVK